MNVFSLNREGESGTVPFRSGRFYSVGNEWFFAVRRGEDMGPFTSQQAARHALVDYINDQLSFEKNLEDSTGSAAQQSVH